VPLGAIGELSFGNFVSSRLIYAFMNGDARELSSDRAALLVTDDLNVVMHSIMKVAGGSVQ